MPAGIQVSYFMFLVAHTCSLIVTMETNGTLPVLLYCSEISRQKSYSFKVLSNTGRTESLCIFILAPHLLSRSEQNLTQALRQGKLILVRNFSSLRFSVAETVHKIFVKQQKLVKQSKIELMQMLTKPTI